MPFNPEVTVAAVVERDARFLLVEERIAGRLVLNQPAGHLEDRETLLDAVVRETREETAWRFIPTALVGTYLWRNPDTAAPSCASRSAARSTTPGGPAARHRHRAHRVAVARADPRQQARLRSPLVLRCIDDYLLGQRQPLDSVACARSRIRAARSPRSSTSSRLGTAAAAYNSRREFRYPAKESSSACPAASTPPSPHCCCGAPASTCTGST